MSKFQFFINIRITLRNLSLIKMNSHMKADLANDTRKFIDM